MEVLAAKCAFFVTIVDLAVWAGEVINFFRHKMIYYMIMMFNNDKRRDSFMPAN